MAVPLTSAGSSNSERDLSPSPTPSNTLARIFRVLVCPARFFKIISISAVLSLKPASLASASLAIRKPFSSGVSANTELVIITKLMTMVNLLNSFIVFSFLFMR